MNLTEKQADLIVDAARDCMNRWFEAHGCTNCMPILFVSRDLAKKICMAPRILKMECQIDPDLTGFSMYCQIGHYEGCA